MARTDTPQTILRSDYRPAAFAIDTVALEFDLDPVATRVVSRLAVRRTTHADQTDTPLTLDGDGLALISVTLDGAPWQNYRLDGDRLVLQGVPDAFVLTIETRCNPQANTTLMGLYRSNGNYFTQCEAEGFRKITFFLDRPDVMARYQVTLRADRASCPVLLSNGNLVDAGELPDGRHYAVWDDPFPKPSYLFALVAGTLVCIEHTLQSASGRDKLLQVWVEARDLDKTRHAMDSLIASIRWDEQRFGLELDLDRFMIVAVGDFNMGAMENKGLNIFNTKFVLASPDTATDTDFANVEAVVAHEYFHNWTGNRVTCRDWFQLSLKEGLTVFRDQEFSADMMGSPSGRAVKRIDDVRLLRQLQFAEDAGPMAHPVRPDSYQEINNFYTVTVYEKGAEVVRMYQTLLGRDGFRAGMDLYFQRHDGQAVTCDDFRAAMADANGRDLSQFERWYQQAGTPRVTATGHHDPAAQTYTLTLAQHCPPTPGQPLKQPFHIPFALGLVDADGCDLPLILAGEPNQDDAAATTRVLELTQPQQSFVFAGIAQQPVPSLLRDFSAPVVVDYPYTDAELLHLLAHDSDPFNRWEAGQRLMLNRILAAYRAPIGQPPALDDAFVTACAALLDDATLDPAFRDCALTLPAEAYVAEQLDGVDPQAVHAARESVRLGLAQALAPQWAQTWRAQQSSGAYRPDAVSCGQRSLKNLALAMWIDSGAVAAADAALAQYHGANNMTDRFAALAALVNGGAASAEGALVDFHQRYRHEPLVLDKWFALQAGRRPESCAQPLVDAVRALTAHPDFVPTNPNRVCSVVHAFCSGNPAGFHRADGAGYAFWVEQVCALDARNPQVAARLARALDRWQKFAPPYRDAMRAALERVAALRGGLSRDVAEVIDKALA